MSESWGVFSLLKYTPLRIYHLPEKWVVWDPNPNQVSVWIKTAKKTLSKNILRRFSNIDVSAC